jgi:hypothetical protein
MSNASTQDSLPEICVRIPGPWKGPEEVADRLPAGFHLQQQELVMPDGRCLVFQAMPPDNEFPSVFRIACRRSPKQNEMAGVESYRVNFALIGPGGSLQAAQRMLEAGAALVRAGGAGVFIDGSASAHGASDWLEMAEHRDDPAAVFFAFVNIVKSGPDLVSYGMHQLGQPDAIIVHRGKVDAVLPSLEDFLRMTSAAELPLGEGEIFCDEQGRCFSLHREPDSGKFGDTHPISNPYGRWRLKPAK